MQFRGVKDKSSVLAGSYLSISLKREAYLTMMGILLVWQVPFGPLTIC